MTRRDREKPNTTDPPSVCHTPTVSPPTPVKENARFAANYGRRFFKWLTAAIKSTNPASTAASQHLATQTPNGLIPVGLDRVTQRN